jgi:cytochrome P450
VPGIGECAPLFTDPTVMLKDPLGTTSLIIEQCGSIAYMPSIDSYIISDAELIEEMLTINERAFSKSAETMDKISPAIGRGLSTLIGDEWKRQRRLANPSFNKRSVVSFVDVFHECIDEMFDAWDRHGSSEIDITREMKKLTLRIVIKCLFSTDIASFSDDVTLSLEVLQEFSILKLWSPDSIDSAQQGEYEHAKEKIDGIIYGIIADRRAHPNQNRQDLLAMYMSAVYEDTRAGMSDEQLRHEIMNLFLAGHETTANGVAFAFYLLAKNAPEQQKIMAEVDRVLGAGKGNAEQLKQLEFTARVFKESLRLYPSSWGMSRVALEPYQFNGYSIPAGADIIIAQWGLHRSAAYWQDPLVFDPDRFLPDRIKNVHKYAYLPFGAGARKCIGFLLAESEGQTILARVAQRYRLELSEHTLVSLKARLFMTSEPGVILNIYRRQTGE